MSVVIVKDVPVSVTIRQRDLEFLSGIINMGAYGGTSHAGKSYVGKHRCETIVAGDINGNWIIDARDFSIIALRSCQDNNP